MFCSGRKLPLAIAFSILAACGSSTEPVPEPLVFVPFDYLGTATDSEWLGRAAANLTATQTSSLSAPGIREALANHTPHIVEGYVTGQPGALRVVAAIRDESNQRTIRTLEARGANVLDLAKGLAGQITSKPTPYTTANSEAVHQLFAGNPGAAVALDPGYGSAHIVLIEELLRAGKQDEARQAVLAGDKARLSAIERARLEAFAAGTPKRRSDAMLQAARAAKYDLGLWLAAADAAMNAKDHAGAIEAYQRATTIDPDNVATWNTLAYAQAFAGDIEGAKRSIAQYRTLQPRDANAHDSLAEIYLYDGRFGDAEQEFLRAFEMNNARLGGGEAYRAGLAAFLAGDRAKADSHFARYLAFRKQYKDELAELRESIWLYTTGRKAEGRTKASALPISAAKSQLAIWDAVEGKGAAAAFGDRPEFVGWKLLALGRYSEAVDYWKRIYDGTSMLAGSDARVMLAASLHGAKLYAEAQAVLSKWPFPPQGADPGFSSVVFSKAIELKAASR